MDTNLESFIKLIAIPGINAKTLLVLIDNYFAEHDIKPSII